MVQTNILLPEDLRNKLKLLASVNGTTTAVLIRSTLEKLCEANMDILQPILDAQQKKGA